MDNNPKKYTKKYLGKPFPSTIKESFAIGICILSNKEGNIHPKFKLMKISKRLGLETEKIDSSSAFCNGNGHLYISGGKTKEGASKLLWDFNLKYYNKSKDKFCTKYTMPYENYYHSMIFIPKKYIFL